MNTKKTILLLSHGPLCTAILESMEMIIGPGENIHALPLMPGTTPDEYLKSVMEMLDNAKDGAIIVTDIQGGTPCNVAIMLTKKYSVDVFTGLNLPMLIGLDDIRSNNALTEGYESLLVNAAREGIQHLAVK